MTTTTTTPTFIELSKNLLEANNRIMNDNEIIADSIDGIIEKLDEISIKLKEKCPNLIFQFDNTIDYDLDLVMFELNVMTKSGKIIVTLLFYCNGNVFIKSVGAEKDLLSINFSEIDKIIGHTKSLLFPKINFPEE